jgi:GT2 family glycosyltransferase
MGVSRPARESAPAVSVCVAVYKAHGEPNLAALQRALPAALDGLSGELVVALNGISAADAGAGRSARTIELPVNRGVAPGWNAAATQARGETLIFVNDDVVLGRRSLAALQRALEAHRDVGVVASGGCSWDFAVADTAAVLDLRGRAPGELVDCDAVTGFLFAARREVFDAAGGFDEAYAPCSFEEIDFCTAVRRRLGLRCCALTGIDVAHEWGISRRAMPWKRIRFDGRSETLRSIHRRNRAHFMAKWPAESEPH